MGKEPKITLRRAQGNTEQGRSITKEMTISEVAQKYPKTTFVFLDYGLYCVGCPVAPDETIEEAAKVHQLDLTKFLKDLNKAIDKK
jgi:hybrid cluster-associated redox disulfide protein